MLLIKHLSLNFLIKLIFIKFGSLGCHFFVEKDTHNIDEYQKAVPLTLRILGRNIWQKTAFHHVKLVLHNASYFIYLFIYSLKFSCAYLGARGENKCRNVVK